MMARTPASVIALLVSMLSNRACGRWLRAIAPTSALGADWFNTYGTRPRARRAASTIGSRSPIAISVYRSGFRRPGASRRVFSQAGAFAYDTVDRMRSAIAIGLALLAAAPAFLLRFGGVEAPVPVATVAFGLGIVGAAFAMSWAAEAAEHDIPRALALTVVALLAVLPEYAVDIIFAYKAGSDPTFAPYAAANMTGSNRLLLGLGWPTVTVVAWLVGGRRVLRLERDAALALLFLAVATVYSFSLPLKASVSALDSLVLIGLFGVYVVLAARQGGEEPELVGPAATIGRLPAGARRLTIMALFAFAGLTIGASAEPFAEGLVRTGQALHIDEFLLVQWLAPLASETPEFLVAILLTMRGKAAAAMGLLLSAKVNQWTLLVGSLALAYSLGAGQPAALPLDARQVSEVLLTAAQSFFGLAVLANRVFTLRDAVFLAGLFAAQLILGGVLRAGLQSPTAASAEMFVFSGLYLVLGLLQLVRGRKSLVVLKNAGATLAETEEADQAA
jgi:cation:H+ antiporter